MVCLDSRFRRARFVGFSPRPELFEFAAGSLQRMRFRTEIASASTKNDSKPMRYPTAFSILLGTCRPAPAKQRSLACVCEPGGHDVDMATKLSLSLLFLVTALVEKPFYRHLVRVAGIGLSAPDPS